jgi:phospholipid/cholesterol/gamma-HCH transport system substrate-binding protein
MMRRRLALVTAVALVGLLVAGSLLVIRTVFFGPTTITAYFKSATAIYPGDEVRVAGVRVGTITAIEPAGAQARMTLAVDRDVLIPADARAVLVAQNLISSRYVQLAPSYRDTGPTMQDGAEIPAERTAIPVEWDEVKTQLNRLAEDLGPRGGVSETSVSRFINSAATAMDGNGDKLRQTLKELSGVGRILADGSGNIADILTNLQTFVSALKDSDVQLVEFGDRLATLSSVLDDNGSELDGAIKNLSSAIGDVQRFVAGTRDQTAEQLQRLTNVTQNLVDHRIDLENVLHVAPNALANVTNAYNPDTGTTVGSFALNNFANPVQFICGNIGAIENATVPETAKLCSQYLGPALNIANPFSLLNVNNVPTPINPYLQRSANPDNIIYTEPRLAPGGMGPKPENMEQPPAISAYGGVQPGPPPFTNRAPGVPPPGAYPGAPPNMPATVDGMLLPAGPPADSPPPSPLPAEAGAPG